LYFSPPKTAPYLLTLFFTFCTFSAGIDFVSDVSTPVQIRDLSRLLLSVGLAYLAGSLPMKMFLPWGNVAKSRDVPSSTLSSPEDRVSLWEWLTFSFVEPILDLAPSEEDRDNIPQTLNGEDVWSLPPTFLHRNLFMKYPTHSILLFLVRSNSLDLIIDVAVEMWKACVGYAPSYALKQILALLALNTPSARSNAYLYALLTFVAHLSFAQLDLFQGWHTRRCYERTRGQLFCALHWKALKRRDINGNNGTVNEPVKGDVAAADLGKVVNLMQGDTYAVAQRFWQFSGVIAAPVRLTIALVFLYNVLGWSSFAGVIVIIVTWALNYPLARWNIFITRASWRAKDARMSGVNELFQSIRFLKYYGWDGRWAKRVETLREVELGWRVKEGIVDTLISFIWTWVPSATALFAFMSYTLIEGKALTVSKAFVSVALFEQLQSPLRELPGQVFALLNAYVSMQRIESYLAEPEVPAWASSLTAGPDKLNTQIGFEKASFEWHGAPGAFRLDDIDVIFPIGKLTLIFGRTGSGKSAFLGALLGELNCMSGTVHLNKTNHRVAYCAQNPWLEHATIKDNILYGREYDPERYSKVVEACALERDLEALPAGDMTEIGEKGVTLSGGQRSRIALARAVYSRAECILLDDPLAAVDMHTAHHIYDCCIAGELFQGRTIILVTHHISLCLPKAAYVVELSGGKVVHQGTVDTLRKTGELDHINEGTPNLKSEEAGSSSVAMPTNEADASLEPEELSKTKTKGKLVQAETREKGRIKTSTYLTYLNAGGWFYWLLTFTMLITIRGVTIGNHIFLAKWGEAYGNSADSTRPHILSHLPPPAVNVRPWLLILFLISITGAISELVSIALGYITSIRASRKLFRTMLFRLCRAPIRFFDITPMGRVLNRFVTDFGTIDGALTDSVRRMLTGILTFISSFGVIVLLLPSFLPFAIIIAWLYIRLAPAFILASRDLRRLELTSLSPTFASFDELLHGLTHVRAFAMESWYQDRFYKKVDRFQSYDHVYWLLSIWMRWRYDCKCLGSVVVFCATIFSLWAGVDSGYAAVIIVQAGVFAESSRQLIRISAQLELDFNSVERIAEYLELEEEAPAIIHSNRPPAYWPSSSGGLSIEKLIVKYSAELPPVLNGLSLELHPKEKIGVVTQYVSGKSTLALSLLRMVEPVGGRIILDGLDICAIGLEDLRTRVTIISQDVSLFSGTIRSNIDPFNEHDDQECWNVLKRCHLVDNTNGSGRISSLDTPINETGSLSAGERQLVALARAVLRRSQVVIMDEATSAIDLHLDEMVQHTIREELSESLVITIAHRLRTVIDYDRVMVLGTGGRLLEFDTPEKLLSNPSGVFTQMCRKSTDWDELNAVTQIELFP
ncbi:P-loop containing nucleoside triphosphate hydrolase protein, partial [Hysterangium stoloniferum]